MIRLTAVALISLIAALPVLADDKHHNDGTSAAAGAMADGEVRKVDKDAKKITIKHGPLESLDMPAMTMVFQVKEPSMLEQVKAGDKVKFAAEKIGGQFTVTRIVVGR